MKRAESREQEEHTGDKREVEGSKMSSGMPQNEPKRAQDSGKQAQGRPKTAPRGAQEGEKSEPKPQDEKRTEPSRSQDHLGVAKGAIRRLFPHPQGGIWAPQNDQKRNQKRSTKETKIKKQKEAIQDEQGPILERSWSLWVCHVGAPRPQKYWKT